MRERDREQREEGYKAGQQKSCKEYLDKEIYGKRETIKGYAGVYPIIVVVMMILIIIMIIILPTIIMMIIHLFEGAFQDTQSRHTKQPAQYVHGDNRLML